MSIMENMSGVNLGRLFGQLVDPDRIMTPAEKNLAEHCMNEISGGARHGNNPNYKHKGEAKPGLRKTKERTTPKRRPKKVFDKVRIPRELSRSDVI